MEFHKNLGYDLCEVRSDLSAENLWDVEKYFREQGVSEFIYDEPLDVLRFLEDGRFAFCREFADWKRLQERGYLHFSGTLLCNSRRRPGSSSGAPGPSGRGYTELRVDGVLGNPHSPDLVPEGRPTPL